MNKLKLSFKIFKKSTTMKSGVWYLLSNFLVKGMAFITIPVFTRLLTIEGYGIASVFASFVGIFTIITGADLHAGIGRAQIDFGKDYKKYLSSVLNLSLLFFIGTFLIVLFLQEPFSTLAELPSNILIIAVVVGYFGFIFNYLNTHFLFRQDYKKRTAFQVSKAISQVALSIILVILITQNKYLGKIYGQLIISTLFAIIAFVIVVYYGRKLFFLRAWKYALMIGVPLIPHNLSQIVLAQFDKMAIQSIVGATETGLYSFAYNIGMIPLVVLTATNSAWGPWFFKQKTIDKTEKIRRATKIYTTGFLTITIGIMVFSPELALIMAPSNFITSLRIVPG
jgi:O-antigen/teichoic acid export membrane protein